MTSCAPSGIRRASRRVANHAAEMPDVKDSPDHSPMGLKALGWHWEQFARRDPLWAILAVPGKRGGKWDPADFFATGRAEVAGVLTYLDGLGVKVRRGNALDFGCGVGRLTQALAATFEHAVGIDISTTMVRLARRYNQHGRRCRYIANRREDLTCLGARRFDFIYTNVVLQHMEGRLALGYVGEFLRLLAPGGVCVFQLPFQALAWPGASIRAIEEPIQLRGWPALLARLRGDRSREATVVIEMHAVPQEEVVALVEARGARVIDIVEDNAAGGGHRSARYCIGV